MLAVEVVDRPADRQFIHMLFFVLALRQESDRSTIGGGVRAAGSAADAAAA